MRDARTAILSFWFDESVPIQWQQVNPDYDNKVKERFLDLYSLASQGLFDVWEHDDTGALALILLFDQFPQFMFRGTLRVFERLDDAVRLAHFSLLRGFDQMTLPERRKFFYFPLLHSENFLDVELGVQKCFLQRDQEPIVYEQAVRAREIITMFGRYPERNTLLGRASTPEEISFLKEHSSF